MLLALLVRFGGLGCLKGKVGNIQIILVEGWFCNHLRKVA